MNLKSYTKNELSKHATSREGETKLLDSITVSTLDDLKKHPSSFVILGIPEDIGVRANHGIGGAHTMWPSFLKNFLSLQSNSNIDGREIILLGHLEVDIPKTQELSVDALRGLTSMLDEEVYPIVLEIYQAGHIPIVIGGGHNNAYPIIKATATYNGQATKVLNMDLHHDFRRTEGRHSGNPFSYAMKDGHLGAYLMWGLSKYYSQQSFLDNWTSNDSLFIVFYETLLMNSFEQNIELLRQYIESLAMDKLGLEVDLDSVEGMLSSAMTPSGFSPKEIRAYVTTVARHRPSYIHICEGAPERADGLTDPNVGKLASLLAADFILSYKSSLHG